jgi:hypothetical protein
MAYIIILYCVIGWIGDGYDIKSFRTFLIDKPITWKTRRYQVLSTYFIYLHTSLLYAYAVILILYLYICLFVCSGRVVVLSSSLHHSVRHFDLDDIMSKHSYTLFGTYARSKLANILFALELCRR